MQQFYVRRWDRYGLETKAHNWLDCPAVYVGSDLRTPTARLQIRNLSMHSLKHAGLS